MRYKKLRTFIDKGNEKGATEFLEQEFFMNRNQIHWNLENYSILKDLIRNAKKEKIRKCIEKGFPVNIDKEDESFDGTPLHVAVLSECPEMVQLLLDSGSCMYKNNGNGETPLLLSAIAGINRVTDLLLSHIEPKECSNREGFSHFHVACMRNREELVHQFLMSGTNIHQSVKKDSHFWSGFTPLHFAVEYRSIDVVEFLVKSGADITVKNGQGLTPLHLAFRKRNRKMIDILLSVQCFFQDNPAEQEGLSHFHIACATNNEDVVKDFLEKGVILGNTIDYKSHNWFSYDAYTFAINNDCMNILQYLLKYDDRLMEKLGCGILRDAYRYSNPGIFNLIISHYEKNMVKFQCMSLLEDHSDQKQKSPAEVQSKSSEIRGVGFKIFEISHQTTLHHAVLCKDSRLVNSLLDTCPPYITTMADLNGKTPLHLAFDANQMGLVQRLLDKNFYTDKNPTDRNGLSHFHIACAAADVNVVKDFFKKEVDINSHVKMDSTSWAGFTPLHFAVWFHQVQVAKLLLEEGANFAAKNASKLSPYDFAIPTYTKFSYKSSNRIVDFKYDGNQWDLVKEILSANNHRKMHGFDDRGITPLHVAAIYNDIPTIKLLANADTINRTTSLNLPPCYAGLTPLHFAAFNAMEEAVEILLDRGSDLAIQSAQKRTAAHNCWTEFLYRKVGRRLLFSPKNVYDEEGISLLHLACNTRNLEAVRHFLKMGVDVDEPIRFECDHEGKTPLHLAVEADDSEIIKLLLDQGANVNARDCYFDTPISLCRSTAVLKILFEAGADPQALDYRCKTAFSRAISNCYDGDYIITLIENGWDINEEDKESTKSIMDSEAYNKFLLMRHIESLMVAGIRLKEHVTDLYNELIADLRNALLRVSMAFKENCAMKLKSMKEVKIDARTTLYDILSKNAKDMVKYSKNETLQKIMNAQQDLRRNYSMYAYLVILQFKRGQKRANLMEQGKTSLNLIANKWLGDVVFESILQFLNDYEIQYLIYATSGQNILPRQRLLKV